MNTDLPSCDTFAISKALANCSSNLLAKNSDRPIGEAQALCYYPPADHPDNALLQCTHLQIPQVRQTYAVLGSRPYWIWGFEMGVNEHGVCIGNEAEGSKCDPETEEGLLGMDLLRLALERSRTASEAVQVITGLLEKYGQNANASMLFDRRYENSFLIMDPDTILKLETAGRQWAMQEVTEWAAISNCYTIRTDYHACSQNAEALARAKKWLKESEDFDFAKAYTCPADRQKNAVPRFRRMEKLIKGAAHPVSTETVKAILRDHFEGELIEPRFGAINGTFYTICMHAESMSDAETSASWIVHYEDELGIVCRYAVTTPCCSVYIPVCFGLRIPWALSTVSGQYDDQSLWWRFERLALLTGLDEEQFSPLVRPVLRGKETELDTVFSAAAAQAKTLFRSGKRREGTALLQSFADQAVDDLMELTGSLSEKLCGAIKAEGGLYGPRKELTEEFAKYVSMPLLS